GIDGGGLGGGLAGERDGGAWGAGEGGEGQVGVPHRGVRRGNVDAGVAGLCGVVAEGFVVVGHGAGDHLENATRADKGDVVGNLVEVARREECKVGGLGINGTGGGKLAGR